ncbi:LysE family translocator [Pelagibius sp. CAU 1746]|uniref:LysE family translocator n=1 Tax=Pelagibius sp. CAU 1746 TaxID=3140370 RepID=UPI00325C1D1B
MPPADLLISFFLASAAFACLPGTSMVYVAARTLASGRRAGWWSALGFHLAGLGHVAAAAFGVSALLSVMPAVFTAMKLIGASYLLWLGFTYLRGTPAPVRRAGKSKAPTARSALRDSAIVEATNPKTALFFLAFLPQFTDPEAAWPVWGQIVVLGVTVNAMFSLTDAVLIEASQAAAARLRSSATSLRLLRRLCGCLLIALGVELAWARPP